MDPATIALIVQLVAKYGPGFVMALMEVCHTEKPTLEQWRAAFSLAKEPLEPITPQKSTVQINQTPT